jgi:hypothetical protein
MLSMMYYDHAMLGATLTVAVGAGCRHGWASVALGAGAAMLPDWDALSRHWGPDAYRSVHRVWGHSLLVAVPSAALLGLIGYLIYLSCRTSRPGQPAADTAGRPAGTFSGQACAAWVALAVLACLSHLLLDLLYCGLRTAPDWPVALGWPLWRRGWALPLIPWSDWGATFILAGALVALLCLRSHARLLACAALLVLAGYVGVRGAAARLLS